MKIISRQKFKEQQMQDKLIKLVTPKTNDRTEFEDACKQFKSICESIRKLLGKESFTGSFEEMLQFQESSEAKTPDGLLLMMKWNTINSLCTYLASKLGISQPDWWKECWQYPLS